MKKIFITAGMLCAGFFFAQEGNIGINTNAPGATLDVNISPDITDATKGQGVAVPRVSKERLAQMTGNIVTSSLVYVDREKNGDTTFDDTALTATVGSVNRVAKVDAVGFYYFDGSQWSKLNAGNANTSPINIYTEDGTLDEARTVTQNNQSLTFVTGGTPGVDKINTTYKSAEFIVDGTQRNLGAVYADKVLGVGKNIRKYDGSVAPTYYDTDYIIIVTNNSLNGQFTLPDATKNIGRMLYILNGSTSPINFPNVDKKFKAFNFSTISAKSGVGFVSDGEEWFPIGR